MCQISWGQIYTRVNIYWGQIHRGQITRSHISQGQIFRCQIPHGQTSRDQTFWGQTSRGQNSQYQVSKIKMKSPVHNIPLSRQKKLDKLGYLSKRLLKVIVLKSLMTVCLSTENCCHFDLEFFDPLSARLFHLFDFEFMLTAYCFKVN